MSARSSLRMRSRRSSPSWPASRTIHGPNTRTTPRAVASTAMPTLPTAPNASLVARKMAMPSTSRSAPPSIRSHSPGRCAGPRRGLPGRRARPRLAPAGAVALAGRGSTPRHRLAPPGRCRSRRASPARRGGRGRTATVQRTSTSSAERDAAHRQGQLGVAPARAVAASPRGRAAVLPPGPRPRRRRGRLGQHDPGDEVGEHADAVGQRQDHRGQAHDDGVDAEPPGHARADARHDVLVGAADQARAGGRGSADRGWWPSARRHDDADRRRSRLRDALGDIPDCRPVAPTGSWRHEQQQTRPPVSAPPPAPPRPSHSGHRGGMGGSCVSRMTARSPACAAGSPIGWAST